MSDVTYAPADCCMCRWIVWNEDCGHPESDGLDSPHDHCPMHGGLTDDQAADDAEAMAAGNFV